jgi:hypothetical protein
MFRSARVRTQFKCQSFPQSSICPPPPRNHHHHHHHHLQLARRLSSTFIQQQHLWILDNRACNRNSLFLASGKSDPSFSYFGRVALRKLANELFSRRAEQSEPVLKNRRLSMSISQRWAYLVAVGLRGRVNDLLFGVHASIADVFADTSRKQCWLLCHQSYMTPKEARILVRCGGFGQQQKWISKRTIPDAKSSIPTSGHRSLSGQ